jgi:hypothetical protein
MKILRAGAPLASSRDRKGETTPLDTIEARHKFSAQNFAELPERYAAAFEYYRQGDSVEAERRFRELPTF